jgi:hypothetical protein
MALILRLVKGTDLTFVEMDNNLVYLYQQTVTQIDIISNVSAGSINAGDTVPAGSNLQAFVKQLLTKTYYPTFTPAYATLSTGKSSLQVIGSSLNITLVVNFDRGKILGYNVNNIWDPTKFQGYLVGPVNIYTINGITPLYSSSLTINGYKVIQGKNTFTASVDYAGGQQPKDSTGANYKNQAYPGVLSADSSFEGVYPIYAPTESAKQPTGIGSLVASEQPLYSMTSDNNIIIDLVAEPNIIGGGKQYVDIPTTWINSRNLKQILYYSTIAKQWDTTNQLAPNAMQFFGTITYTIEGNNINYNRYINTGPNHGVNKIQLIF